MTSITIFSPVVTNKGFIWKEWVSCSQLIRIKGSCDPSKPRYMLSNDPTHWEAVPQYQEALNLNTQGC